MATEGSTRRLSYVFLLASPLVAVIPAGVRALRVPGLYQPVGAVLFLLMAAAVWTLGGRAIRAQALQSRQLALAGALLVAPFALVALLWVGLGTPWQATAKENQMRYLVLIAMTIAEVSGFLMAREALTEAGERFSSTLVLAVMSLAGPIYVVWNAFLFGAFFAKEHGGQVPPAFLALDRVMDLLLDVAEILTYLAAAALALGLGRVQWLGRSASRAFAIVSLIALFLLVNRGLKYLAPSDLSAPWYATPGFIVGIPAVPFIMPLLLGVVLLRRAGETAEVPLVR